MMMMTETVQIVNQIQKSKMIIGPPQRNVSLNTSISEAAEQLLYPTSRIENLSS